MSEQNNISSLDQEKKEVQALLNQQAVAEFEMQINTVPENYFEQFSENIIFTIQKKKKPSLLIRLSKLSVAAAILFLVAGSYFLVSTYYINNTSTIAIHEIPTVEIDAYVSNNEWMADAEMQMEINKIGLNLDVDNSSKDSID
jgi:predicted dinucleotide-binding enzyme